MSSTILMGYSPKAKKFFTQQIVADGSRVYLKDNEIDSTNWAEEYDHLVLLPFGHRNYILCQSKSTYRVYINEILKDGTLSEFESDSSTWNTYYPNLFSYQINGNVYLVGQNSGKFFFIQRITSNGKFEKTTFADGTSWPEFYKTMGCFEVNNRVFLYAHNDNDNYFFTRELLANGKLADGNSAPIKLGKYYSTMGTIKVDGKTYLYGQSSDSTFFSHELNGEGKFVRTDIEIIPAKWSNFHSSLGSIYLNNKSYIYGFSEKAKKFIIQEVLTGGRLAKDVTYSKNWENSYTSLIALTSDEFAFGDTWMDQFYQKLPQEKQKTMTLKDYCMPASHDAGMFKVNLATILKFGAGFMQLSKVLHNIVYPKIETQSLDVLGQLRRGVRYFDFRPGIAVNFTGDKEMYFMHFAPGEKLSIAFEQINSFMTGSAETVILHFSHFEIGKESSNQFVKLLEDKLGNKLLNRSVFEKKFPDMKGNDSKKTINNLPISELKGKVIALIDKKEENKFDFSTIEGKNIYKAVYFGESSPADADKFYGDDVLFTVFDHYANKTSFEEMRNDQTRKFKNFGKGENKDSQIHKNALCAIDWTLTMKEPEDLSLITSFSKDDIYTLPGFPPIPVVTPDFIRRLNQFLAKNPEIFSWNNQEKANEVNPELLSPGSAEVFTNPNEQNRMVNFFSLDYVPKGIVDLCIRTMKNYIEKNQKSTR